jgi:RimJ/RimL family protein N-acetyltransferase
LIILRQPSITDLDAAIRVHCDPRTNVFNPGGPATSQRAEEMLRDWITHWKQNGFGYWAVELEEAPGTIIGFGGIMRKQIAHLAGLNMYFRFAPEAWGKGHASQLARAGLSFAFGELQAREVLGLVRPNNLPSRRTLERIGFVQFATADDVPGEEASLIYRAVPQGLV